MARTHPHRLREVRQVALLFVVNFVGLGPIAVGGFAVSAAEHEGHVGPGERRELDAGKGRGQQRDARSLFLFEGTRDDALGRDTQHATGREFAVDGQTQLGEVLEVVGGVERDDQIGRGPARPREVEAPQALLARIPRAGVARA